MSYVNQIYNLGIKNNGYITNKMLLENNIPTIYLSRLLSKGMIDKIEQGIYLLKDYFEDDFYTLSLKYSRLVFSKKTALYLNELTNQQLEYLEGDFPTGYNVSNVKNIKSYVVSNKKYNIGLTEVITPLGNKVKCYNKERCICDLFVYNKNDIEEVKYVIFNYKEMGINYDLLYEYAEELGVKDKVKSIFEVI